MATPRKVLEKELAEKLPRDNGKGDEVTRLDLDHTLPARNYRKRSHGQICQNPADAAAELAGQLTEYAESPDALVITLRRGVPVAIDVAHELDLPLDLMVVRKLRVPGYVDVFMGAVGTGGASIIYEDVVDDFELPDEVIGSVMTREFRRLQWLERAFRGIRPAVDVRDRTVILINDGLADGSTTRAAAALLRGLQAREIIVALPFVNEAVCDEFRDVVDYIVCAEVPASASNRQRSVAWLKRTGKFIRGLSAIRYGNIED